MPPRICVRKLHELAERLVDVGAECVSLERQLGPRLDREEVQHVLSQPARLFAGGGVLRAIPVGDRFLQWSSPDLRDPGSVSVRKPSRWLL